MSNQQLGRAPLNNSGYISISQHLNTSTPEHIQRRVAGLSALAINPLATSGSNNATIPTPRALPKVMRLIRDTY